MKNLLYLFFLLFTFASPCLSESEDPYYTFTKQLSNAQNLILEGKGKEALELLNKLPDLENGKFNNLIDPVRADAYVALNQPSKAIEIYQSKVDFSQGGWPNRYNFSKAYYSAGQFKEAYLELEKLFHITVAQNDLNTTKEALCKIKLDNVNGNSNDKAIEAISQEIKNKEVEFQSLIK